MLFDAARLNLDGLVTITLTNERAGFHSARRIVLQIRLMDVISHKSLWVAPPLSSNKAAATAGTAGDASMLLVRSVLQQIDDRLSLQPMPELTGEAVNNRVGKLAGTPMPPEAALRWLAELRYYQGKKLLGEAEAKAAFKAILGEEAQRP